MNTIFAELIPLLPAWLKHQRQFPGKGRQIDDVKIVCAAPILDCESVAAEIVIIEVRFDDDGSHERYQLLVGQREALSGRLNHVAIGWVGNMIAYDGLWDHDIAGKLLDLLSHGERLDWVRFMLEPDVQIPRGLPNRVLGVEQSNTSVVYGDELILKFYRRVVSGPNPDLDLHRALRIARSPNIAAVRAVISMEIDDETVVLGILQDFVGNSAAGWAMALLSARDLYAEGDLHADEVGGDFAGEACRLGEAVASVHLDLARVLGTVERDPQELAAAMEARLTTAEDAVAALSTRAPAIRATYQQSWPTFLRLWPHTASTATHTSDRRYVRRPAGWSSISRVSRARPSRSACGRTPCFATSRECSAPSTTPRSTSWPSGVTWRSQSYSSPPGRASGRTAISRHSATGTPGWPVPSPETAGSRFGPTNWTKRSTRPCTRSVIDRDSRPSCWRRSVG